MEKETTLDKLNRTLRYAYGTSAFLFYDGVYLIKKLGLLEPYVPKTDDYLSTFMKIFTGLMVAGGSFFVYDMSKIWQKGKDSFLFRKGSIPIGSSKSSQLEEKLAVDNNYLETSDIKYKLNINY